MATSMETVPCTTDFNIDSILKTLEENGYAVVPNVLTPEDCDRYIGEYKAWLQKFTDAGKICKDKNSLIQSYRAGHFSTTWEIRLKCKPVFEQIWKTEKLLSSADAIAISKPPEEGSNLFADPDVEWLHLDQAASRKGLHAFQGGVNLEESTETDHCFRVMAKSHLYHSEFYKAFPSAASSTKKLEFYRLNHEQKAWYDKKDCPRTKVPVPKGGMVLWDSRTVHDNIKPVYGRPHKDRWRFVTFVSMTPAIWARPEDLWIKKKAYEDILTTTHWSSQGLRNFRPFNPKKGEENLTIHELPDIAKTKAARLLFGIEKYDFADGKPNGPKEPIRV